MQARCPGGKTPPARPAGRRLRLKGNRAFSSGRAADLQPPAGRSPPRPTWDNKSRWLSPGKGNEPCGALRVVAHHRGADGVGTHGVAAGKQEPAGRTGSYRLLPGTFAAAVRLDAVNHGPRPRGGRHEAAVTRGTRCFQSPSHAALAGNARQAPPGRNGSTSAGIDSLLVGGIAAVERAGAMPNRFLTAIVTPALGVVLELGQRDHHVRLFVAGVHVEGREDEAAPGHLEPRSTWATRRGCGCPRT